MTLTPQIAMAIALQCLSPSLAPIAVGIAQHESGLDPAAIRHNPNGTTDYGLGQINSSNFAWLSQSIGTPVNERTILDPCLNFRASMRVLFVKYNGNPPDAVKALYAAQVMAQMVPQHAEPTPPAPPPEEPAVVYIRPAHAGHNLVYSNERN